MELILNLLLVVVGFLSFVPVNQLFNTQKSMKYRCLKFLVNATFAWTLLIFIERFSGNMNIVYYAHILGYPLKFLMSIFMLCTIFNYVEIKFPKWQIYILGVIFVIDYLVAITNSKTQFILKLVPEEMNSYKDLYSADHGQLFIIHLILTYAVLLVSIIFLTLFLSKHKEVKHYKVVSRTMTYSVIVVLSFNLIQLISEDISVDLTYLSLVIVTYALYQVIYRKDMIFNIRTSGRGEILSNMREMYVITDSEKRVVEISDLLKTKYEVSISLFEGKPLELLLEALQERIMFYTEYNVDGSTDSTKDHFHIREKKFTLRGMNEFGYMILLYDETQVFKLLRELNKLSNYDNMTGLHNRNFIENLIPSYAEEKNIGVISLDLNGLKANNDYLGHERGDYLLKSLADKMKEETLEYNNTEMARIGGDEFLIILRDSSQKQVEEIKEKILKACENKNILDRISVSVGVVFKEGNNLNIFDLIKEADQEMYRMKQGTSKEYSKEIVLYATNNDEYIR